jgi:hypothetical protein
MKLHYTKFFFLFLFFFSCLIANAQSPEGINYQAALRDSDSGEALKNEMVFIIIRIRDGGPSGTVVFSESHSGILTNDFGLINLVIGGGDATEGSFASIPWSSGNIWYEIEVDSGSGLESLGSSQFLSVPFALFAGNAEQSLDNDPTNELIDSALFDAETQSIVIDESGNLVNVQLEGLNVDDADADATNELITSAIYDSDDNAIILIQADGSELTISLDGLNISDADSDPTNELIDPEEGLQLIGTNLVITEAGISYSVNLDVLVEDADSDPTNELIDPEEGLQLIGTNLVITEAGISYSVNLDVLVEDEDADPTNELIDDEAFTLTNDTILTLSEAGIEHSINLASLRDDGDWKVDEEENTVYNEDQRIGVGTNSPSARLDIVESTSSEVALSVVSGDEPLLHAENERLGIGTTSPLSTVQFGGSVGYDVTLLISDETDNYAASIDDHMIVINFVLGGNLDFGIFLPPANVCEGRVYIIRKTGAFAAFGEITIDTGIFLVDFFTPDLVLNENGVETAVLLSLGIDGWTRILRDN